jgi:hypothetical protein
MQTFIQEAGEIMNKFEMSDFNNFLTGKDKQFMVNEFKTLVKLYPEIKEYYASKISPDNEKQIMKKYREKIYAEFFPQWGFGKLRYPVMHKAIRDFKKICRHPENLAELYLAYVEGGIRYTKVYGNIDDRIYETILRIHKTALNYILDNNLSDLFDDRLETLFRESSGFGWGFTDGLKHNYYQYLSEKGEIDVDTLVPMIAKAPAEDRHRDKWMERLWEAIQQDEMPFIDLLMEHWGDLCVTRERASLWADKLIPGVRLLLSSDKKLTGFFAGTPACLASLYKAERYGEIIELLELDTCKFWHYRKWGTQALVAMGRKADAVNYADDARGLNHESAEISRACEEILLSCGMVEEAYKRYAVEANLKGTFIATFKTIARKYPHKNSRDILEDLVEYAPDEQNRWFEDTKSANLYNLAIELADSTLSESKPVRHLINDSIDIEPEYALEQGISALI